MNQLKKIVLTDEMISNLKVFLDRCEIKGLKEVQAFNQLFAAINQPQPELPPQPKTENNKNGEDSKSF